MMAPPDEPPGHDETLDLPSGQDSSSDGRESRPSDEKTSATVSTRFKLGARLGEGGMGDVREAADSHLPQVVAVKCLKNHLTKDSRQRQRFVEEARIMAQLSHPGIVPVYDAGVMADGRPFYAMKKLEGRTLADLLRNRSLGTIQDRSAMLHFVDLFERICQTMAFAHAKQIVHRDLKPSNVMVDEFGAVLLLDWGLAKKLTTEEAPFIEDLTEVGQVQGTPSYMSPEQAHGLAEVRDFRADVFALGAILYEMLTGQKPFSGPTVQAVLDEVLHHDPPPPRKINPNAGRELSAICMKALAKDPRRRYPSAKELAKDIRRFREFRAVSAIKPRLVDLAVNWTRRHRTLSAGLGTALLMAVVALMFFGVRAYNRFQMVERGLQSVALAQHDAEVLEREFTEVREQLAVIGEEASKAQVESRLTEARAKLMAKHLELRGKIAAILGFTYGSADRRAIDLARSHSFELLDLLEEIGHPAAARALIDNMIDQYERANVLELTPEEVGRLQARQAALGNP
ncbi:MAG: serine/threonine protein kinase [Acidobacteriota bacterium]|nr:MAG: serine/threonine protein kinase [Acidobacteriota bacterium]